VHAFLSSNYSAIVAGGAVVGAGLWLAYRVGVWRCASRISARLKSDRDFGIAILEELAGRWGVKVEHQELPGSK
jgi:hypothetical protein